MNTSRVRPPWLAFGACLLLLGASPARALPPGFQIEEVHTSLTYPTSIRFAPDGRLFVTQLGGTIGYYLTPSTTLLVPWALVSVGTTGEQGLHGMALHPDFPDSPYVYVSYTSASPQMDRLVRWKEVGGLGAQPTILHERSGIADYHHGGRVAFGPDGMIYLTTGDQQDPTLSQLASDARGKILRLGRGGKPAPGNPWGTTNPAILLGVRNPFGLCFDPRDGDGYFTENGPECDDELNVLAFGANYGWGPNDFCGGQPAGAFPALRSWTPTIAPTGCCVYRGDGFPPHFDGNLFFGSFNTASVNRVRFVAGRPDLVDTLEVFAYIGEPVLDVTQGPDGQLWVATVTRILRIKYAPVVGVETPPAATARPALSFAPNPFRDAVALRAEGISPGAGIEVLDLQGRRVRAWTVPESGRVTWDGRTSSGMPAPAGIYLVRAHGPEGQVTGRVIRLGP